MPGLPRREEGIWEGDSVGPPAESDSILRGAAAVKPEVREANYPFITSA
ncbi:MAG: hypothetical protein RXN87_05590 [Acidilobus sp.]